VKWLCKISTHGLYNISPQEVDRVLTQLGFNADRTSGSHIIYAKPNHPCKPSVPNHRHIAPGTMNQIIRCTGVPKQTFIQMLG